VNNEIMDFLATENARIDNGEKWLTVDEKDTCYVITVYQHEYHKRKATVIYEGYDLELALQRLKGDTE
jgi:hypothetical protein